MGPANSLHVSRSNNTVRRIIDLIWNPEPFQSYRNSIETFNFAKIDCGSFNISTNLNDRSEVEAANSPFPTHAIFAPPSSPLNWNRSICSVLPSAWTRLWVTWKKQYLLRWNICHWNDRLGFDSRSGQPKTRKIGIHSFPAWRSAL